MAEIVIDVRDLWFSFNGRTILENVNLHLARGDFTAVIGPNGGGKTTLLKVLLGLLRPLRGTVNILGKPPVKVSHRVGYVPQHIDVNLRFPITATDVVLMGLLGPGRGLGRHSRSDRSAAEGALEKMDMAPLAGARIGELSGGQRQRIFIARALVADPEILLLDEPSANIDTKGQAELYRLLKRLNDKMTIVLVSHDLLTISTHVKSVACMNRRLHYHGQAEITPEMLEAMYPCTEEGVCPVELIAHGLPHRVLREHKEF